MIRIIRRIKKFFRLLRTPSYRRALRLGVGAAIEHEEVLRRCKPDLVIDVGANVGQFSLVVRHESPDAQIIAFEPLSGPAKTFRAVFSGDRQVELHQVAIGRTAGHDIAMHISARADSSSLLEITRTQIETFPGTQEVGIEKVEVRPLSDFVSELHVPSNAMLKIDVQGYELEVLQATGGVLAKIDWIYVESSFVALYANQALAHEILEFLAARDFSLRSIHNVHQDKTGAVIQADFLFHRHHA